MKISFPLKDFTVFRNKLIRYCENVSPSLVLDSNRYYDSKKDNRSYYHDYELVAGIGAKRIIKSGTGDAYEKLKAARNDSRSWLFGYFGYDLKNELERLESKNPDSVGLSDLFFFEPKFVVEIIGGEIHIHGETEENTRAFFDEIIQSEPLIPVSMPAINLIERTLKEQYLQSVETIRKHIEEGDVYEMNYCMELYSENAVIPPAGFYERLTRFLPEPFGAFGHFGKHFLLSASMERFLKKKGRKLISQPIKGTARRGRDEDEDEKMKADLFLDEKERAENLMIVDLVRNDLSYSCEPGTVEVEELFSIYDYPQVHHMVSTVTGFANTEDEIDIIKKAFPMGSMTGAPKVMAMKLIDRYEKTRRGLYSGALGYFKPDGDFDFSVVIRTMIYNNESKYLSIHTGSAITYDSVPEKEYDECMVKIAGWRKILGN